MERTKLLILRITDRCNLACKYCYAYVEEKNDMSFETAKKAIDLLIGQNKKLKIQFTGGEPLLCIELIEKIFQYGKEKGIEMSLAIQTNGTLLDRKTCIFLKQLRCGIGVSLDGVGEANALRAYPNGRPAFSDTIAGIRNLAQVGLFCNVNTVVTRTNQESLQELPALAAYLGNVKGIGLDMFRTLGRGKSEDFSPDKESLPQNLIILLDKQKELANLGISVKIKELEKVRIMLQRNVEESCYCYAQTKDSIAVDPKGNIYPCASFVGMESMCMGNVDNCTTLSALCWPKLSMLDTRCQKCEVKRFCRGGCPAGRSAYEDRNSRSETDCIMHHTIITYGRERYAENIMPY